MAKAPRAALAERGHLATEREILRVLWNSPADYLVRSEIHRRMSQAHQPSLGRVGQLLAELKTAKLVVTKTQKAQGSKEAAFYQLSEDGVELCRRLGFELQEVALFPISETEQKAVLTRERLTHRPEKPGKITAFYGYRGGIGRTTMAANVARGMAETLDRESLLLIDLDISAPGLDQFFDPPEGCRGLAGLLVDYQRKGDRKRELWLRGAVMSENYVHRPLSEVPNLAFMPSGLGPGSGALTATEHAEAIALLSSETQQGGGGFLEHFGTAILDRYVRTLVDVQTGRGLSPWGATQALADELVLCLRTTDTGKSNLGGLRAVLASFLARRTDSSVIFVFPVWEPVTSAYLNRWIDRHLVPDAGDTAEPPDYKAEVLLYDRQLPYRSNKWGSFSFYSPLVARLAGLDTDATPASSPSLELLTLVLDPRKSWHWRDLAAGVLANTPFQEFGRLLDIYKADTSQQQETDELGHKLIDNIIRGHERRIRSILLPRPSARPRHEAG